jgi:transketolase
VILIAFRSEVNLAVEADENLLSEGIRARIVYPVMGNIRSPDGGLPEQRPAMPPAVKARVAAEQASTCEWERYVGTSGHVMSSV